MTQGWVLRTDSNQVVHAREVIQPDPVGDQVRIHLEELTNPDKPPMRIWGKQPDPKMDGMKLPALEAPRLDLGGESLPSLSSMAVQVDHESTNKTFGETPKDTMVDTEVDSMVDGTGNPVDDEYLVVKTQLLDDYEGILTGLHLRIVQNLQRAMDVVPTNEHVGQLCGAQIGELQLERDALETNLLDLRRAQKQHLVRLCTMAVSGGPGEVEEVLQTVTVPLADVRKEIPKWREAMLKEYNSLVSETKAIEPVMLDQLDMEKVEMIPGKLVTTLKSGPSGGRRKCRAVVCGNQLQGPSQQELDPTPNGWYASGADGHLIRATLQHAAQQGWGAGSLDVRTAFLLAPRPRPADKREVIVIPPRVLVEAQVCTPGERWRVNNALYGFVSSPGLWAGHRDKTMGGFTWMLKGHQYFMKQTEEGNLWKIMRWNDAKTESTCEGHVLVYVDDMLALAPDDVRGSFFERVTQEWKCSPVETVDSQHWLKFCGLELRWTDDGSGLMVGQGSYLQDLLKRHEVKGYKHHPIPKVDIPEDDPNPKIADVRRAQGITGELLWVSVRSRPDVAHAVSVMGRKVTRCPEWVCEMGSHVLEYLNSTKDHCLVYRKSSGDHGSHGNLPVPRHERLIEGFADVSFAPQGDRSHQGVVVCCGGNPIQWEASRQAFHTMSTAEAELVGYCEAMLMMRSIEALQKVLYGCTVDDETTFEKVIYGDNSSAIAILCNPDGGWRTRHLRLRSANLRAELRKEDSSWSIHHQKGTELAADLLTKPITNKVEWTRFREFLGFHAPDCVPLPTKELLVSKVPVAHESKDDLAYNVSETNMAKLKVALKACCRATQLSTGDLRRRCAAALAAVVLLVVREQQNAKARTVSEKKRWEEEKPKENKDNKTVKEVRVNEPALRGSRETEPDYSHWLRENEPRPVPSGPQCNMSHEGFGLAGLATLGSSFGDGSRLVGLVSPGESGDGSGSPNAFRPSHPSPVTASSVKLAPNHSPSGSQNLGSTVPKPWSELKLKAMRASPPALPPGPWDLPEFQYPPRPSSRDSWHMMSHGGYQYVVRLHKKPRKSVIHPLHSTIPVVAANLESQRVTVQYDITNGMKRVRRENWADQSDREGRYSPQWRGFTFFPVRGAAPTSVMPTMEEASDFWNDGAAGEGDGAVGLDCWTRTSEEGHVRQTSSTAAASSTPSHDGRTPPIPYTAEVPLMYEPPAVNNMDHSAGFPVAEVDSDLEVEIGARGVLGKPKYQDALRPSSNREVFQMQLIEASAVPSDVSSLAGYPPTAVGHAATGVP